MTIDHDPPGRETPAALEAAAAQLERAIVDAVRGLGRRGIVVAVSGGVDSGVVAALCARALGPRHVFLLRMPERDVGSASSDLALELAQQLGCETVEEPITAALEGL